MTDKEGLIWLEQRLNDKTSNFRNTKLYKLLKLKLSKEGYWRNLPKGNAKKGYLAMKSKLEAMQ